MAGMPVVVAVVLCAEIAREDFHEGRPRPQKVGIYQPSPMHAHLELLTFKTGKFIYMMLFRQFKAGCVSAAIKETS